MQTLRTYIKKPVVYQFCLCAVQLTVWPGMNNCQSSNCHLDLSLIHFGVNQNQISITRPFTLLKMPGLAISVLSWKQRASFHFTSIYTRVCECMFNKVSSCLIWCDILAIKLGFFMLKSAAVLEMYVFNTQLGRANYTKTKSKYFQR